MAKKKKEIKEDIEVTPVVTEDIPEDTDNSQEKQKVVSLIDEAKAKAAGIIAEAEKSVKARKDLDAEYKKANIVVFLSRYAEHCLTMEPILIKETKTGRSEIVNPGKDLQFHGGIYKTSDKDEIAFLKSHLMFGSDITIAKSSIEAVKAEVDEKIGA